MSLKYLLSIVVLFLVLGFILIKSNRREFDHAKQLVVLRMIGHEILLHGGDSSSRVLPVKQLGADEYQIRFEHPFTFSADSLIRVIERADIAPHYIVNVISCSTQEVVYAYANLDTDIVPCTGRNQQKDCYLINLKFPPARFNMYLLFVLVLPCVGGWYYYGKKKEQPVAGIPIGQFIFDNEAQHLIMNDQKITLTSKESRILYIFATAPNQVIDRNRLQKEVWEDEGVIVGRSLDMFISKLRKKLEVDPAVKLVNVHGKGYKLEISLDYSSSTYSN
jgi:DNA-binding winged helix-turn-helix (wHTH) protein